MMIPEFVPRISHQDGQAHYQDNRVTGSVEIEGQCLTISSWNSSFPGLGHTLQALQWLRSRGFTKIVATGVTLDVTQSERDAVSYWLHMQSLGLVEKLVDDKGVLIGEVGMPRSDDCEVDEFTMRRFFGEAAVSLEKIASALIKPVAQDGSASRASRRMKSYSVLESFSKGQLKTQAEALEDSDILFNLLDSDPNRYSAICQGIFALHYSSSERAALNLVRHSRDIGLVSFEAGFDHPLTYLYNQATGQVLSSNGVQALKEVKKGRAAQFFTPKQASTRILQDGSYDDDLVHFGYVAELILEAQELLG